MPDTDLHPQDWLLIIQPLDELADNLTLCGNELPRAARARFLADRLAVRQGILRDSIQTQLDPFWDGSVEDRRS